MTNRKAKTLEEEEKKFREDIQKIEDSYEETDREFQKWKEGVLKFEHIESGIDDCPDGDNRVCSRECIWADEDEDDGERPDQQIVEGGSGV